MEIFSVELLELSNQLTLEVVLITYVIWGILRIFALLYIRSPEKLIDVFCISFVLNFVVS